MPTPPDRRDDSSPRSSEEMGEETEKQRLTDYYRLRTAQQFCWQDIGIGFLVAGGAYPPTHLLLVGLEELIGKIVVGNFPSVPVAELIFGGIGAFVGAIGAGCLIAGLAVLSMLWPLSLVIQALRIRARQTPIACFLGGVMAFLVTWPSIVGDHGSVARQCLGFLLGPGLATTMGQFGSGYMAMDGDLKRGRRFGKFVPQPTKSGFRFSTWQLLVLTILLSLGLTALRLGGLLQHNLLGWVLVWLAFQSMTLTLNVWLIDRLYKRRLRLRPRGLQPR